MAKKKNEFQVNLLPQEEFDESTFGRVIKWLLSTFRYLVISTEMIVMIAFLSRFWLDAKSNDLTDTINQKKSLIASYATFEDTFRQTQAKLKTFKDYTQGNKLVSPLIKDVASKIPSDVSLVEITLDGSKVVLRASTQNEGSASAFVSSLNSSPFLQNMVVDSVETKNENLIISIKGTLKEVKSGS